MANRICNKKGSNGKYSFLIKILLLCCCQCSSQLHSYAQLPVCGIIYYLSDDNKIYNYNPSQPFSVNNPILNTITCPPGSAGLTVSDNLNGPGASPTFYTTVGGYYQYYDGANWINTGHLIGNANAVEIGAGGGTIYSYVRSNGSVYKYDGTTNASFIPIVGQYNAYSSFDIGADCEGNFYLLNGYQNYLRKYSSSGVLLQTWTISGVNPSDQLTYSGDTIFTQISYGIVDISSPSVNFVVYNPYPNVSSPFTTILGKLANCMDMASCPGGSAQGPIVASIDTGWYCGNGNAIPIDAANMNGPLSVNWSVLNGDAGINGYGTSVTVTSEGLSNILLSSVCYIPDTVTVINPTPSINAGVNQTIPGCNGIYNDTIFGSVLNALPGIIYNYSWSPSAAIISGGNTLYPIISPIVSTEYILIVSTDSLHGNCTWQDSVKISLADSSVIADFTYEVTFGCMGMDTVLFNNQSVGAKSFNWTLGDGSLSQFKDPDHVYPYGDYFIHLTATNTVCTDTVTKTVQAAAHTKQFDLGSDISICKGAPINISLAAEISAGASIAWSDGTSSSTGIVVRDTGTYWVTVSNDPCTVSDTIRVFSELCDCRVSIPTAFSPNADGHNDLFRPVIEPDCPVKGFVMNIYNRWGQMVYTGSNIYSGWDGTFGGLPADIGNYMYVFQLEVGTKSKKYQYKGDVTLIR